MRWSMCPQQIGGIAMRSEVWRTLQVPATLDSLAPIAAAVTTAARAAGLGRQAAYCLRLAVDELAANVITYGYAGVAPGAIDLRIETDERTLTVILEDVAGRNPNVLVVNRPPAVPVGS
jgi:anti-sigma regulatory factor (Ser/Thr protein kinase)